jgi:hypothetical protein
MFPTWQTFSKLKEVREMQQIPTACHLFLDVFVALSLSCLVKLKALLMSLQLHKMLCAYGCLRSFLSTILIMSRRLESSNSHQLSLCFVRENIDQQFNTEFIHIQYEVLKFINRQQNKILLKRPCKMFPTWQTFSKLKEVREMQQIPTRN